MSGHGHETSLLRSWMDHGHTALHRRRLDQRLAAGASPSESSELALRARQLQRSSERHMIATVLGEAFVAAAAYASATPGGRSMQSTWSVECEAVWEAHEALLLLIQTLRSSDEAPIHTIARARLLAFDPASCLYVPAAGGVLQHTLDGLLRDLGHGAPALSTPRMQ